MTNPKRRTLPAAEVLLLDEDTWDAPEGLTARECADHLGQDRSTLWIDELISEVD